ncbi:hypothetical protein F4V43_02040 [Paenibacillus spiritus]|uniref:Uncharacterized protein n=1 Tax=Paenibacillus spiritus TaxID=2496557 RepID=A0A5J5GH03_9BACL|nr:hypothetical protein [Paenibacillus spiritus]KAA9007290.1 hypothetical protein F4V43_02040 [Paenibacillus spiritus]
MQVLKDQTEYVVKMSAEDMKGIWWFFNEYLIDNPTKNEKNEEKWTIAKKYTESFKFVVS